jgi:hypothetical protein
LRACLIVAQVCHSNNVPVVPTSTDFQDICADVLLSRSQLSQSETSSIFGELFQEVGSAKKRSARRKVNQWSSAALTAREYGAETLIIEKMQQPGGNTYVSPANTVFPKNTEDADKLADCCRSSTSLIQTTQISQLNPN